MRVIQTLQKWHIVLAVVAVVFVVLVVLKSTSDTDDGYITTTVTRNTVTESVSVSGFVEAKNTAHLSFPTTGIVTDVMVEEGSIVQKGTILATLGSRTLVAQRTEAIAALRKAQAGYDELVAGPSTEARDITTQTQAAAESTYTQTVQLETEKVENARIALLSNDLAAYTKDVTSAATAPVISGSYTCSEEGLYAITTYRSGAPTGYSYTYEGIEEGTDSVNVRQTAPLGDCGLTIQFDENSNYGNTQWMIPVPNTNSPTYTTYKNAYELAKEAATAAIEAAANNLSLIQREAVFANAAPTTYQSRQSQAAITQAQAAVAAIDAQISEKSIIAPFDGIVTTVDILPGETAGTSPIITLLAEDAFTLTARIPEIDITKIQTNQVAEIVFDAKNDEILTGAVTFVSPLATEIDGVAYFETTITLTQQPTWMRSGLNADIDILTHTVADTLALPKRFIQTDDQGTFVLLDTSEDRTAITVEFYGNDGYAAITGLNAGDTVRVPVAE